MYGGGSEGQDRAQQHIQSSEQQQIYQQKYKFTPEEIRALKECNRESFYFRCLPLGTTLGVGTYYAVRTGYFKPSVRWGAGPKMFAASIFGYFLGKVSYQGQCAEKLMQIPNSPLADMLRKQKGRMGFQETLGIEPGFVSAGPIGGPAFPDSEYSPKKEPGQFTDVGDTRPLVTFDTETASTFGGVDYGKYDTTQQMLNDDNLPQRRSQTFTTSYDELRRSNRDEFEHKGSSPAPSTQAPPPTRGGFSEGQQPPRQSQYPPRNNNNDGGTRVRKNAYGDVWDEKTQ